MFKAILFPCLSGADPGYILTTAQFRLSEILGCCSLDAVVALLVWVPNYHGNGYQNDISIYKLKHKIHVVVLLCIVQH